MHAILLLSSSSCDMGYRRGSEKEFKIENVMTKEMLSQHKRTTI
jgi:hypothetical protein